MLQVTLDPTFPQIARSIESMVQRGVAAARKSLEASAAVKPDSQSKAHAALRAALGKIDTNDRTAEEARRKAVSALQTAIAK